MDLSPDAVEAALKEAEEGKRPPYLLDPDHLSHHVDKIVADYDRPVSLARLDLPEWATRRPDFEATTLEANQLEQLRTALVLYRLRTLHLVPYSTVATSWLQLRAWTRAEERTRCLLLSREATLKMIGQNR